jgi:hypothetical protein
LGGSVRNVSLTLRIAKRLQKSGVNASCAIDSDYLTGVGPIVGVRYEPGADRVIAHVIPFLRVALVIPQDMIEARALPDWLGAWAAHDALRKALFQKPNPAP